MPREDILCLFLSLAARPHSRCIFRALPSTKQALRYASSTAANSSNGNGTNPPDPSRPGTPRSKIPLHVGLDRNPESVSAISRIPIPKGHSGEKFTPSVLARPLGLLFPPRPGQNSPIDRRTLKERSDEFTDYGKALERRRIYLRSYLRPYFQEWRRVDHWKGKSFVSNDRLFKRDKALYFPNIWGQTLSKAGDGPDGGRDTTPVLAGKISVIGIQSGQWAEEQVDTFLHPTHNPQLQEIIDGSRGTVQRVDVNIQGDWMRVMLVKLFKGRLRKMIPEERWERYFLVKLPRDIRRGLTEDVRDAMGLLNSQVGYVYLVDAACKIRWAGSGHAWKGEVDGLNGAIHRLIQEHANTKPNSTVDASKATTGSKTNHAEAENDGPLVSVAAA